MFKGFEKRLKRDIGRKVEERENAQRLRTPNAEAKKIAVEVHTHKFQRFAVWFGASMLASQPSFQGSFHTKAQYKEQGPRIARHNPVFASVRGPRACDGAPWWLTGVPCAQVT
jgi:actin-related protein 3